MNHLLARPAAHGRHQHLARGAQRAHRAQRGVTVLVTLILLTVMLLGGMAMARLGEVGTLASGNAAYREAAVQASEVGINTAYADVRALADEESNVGAWYWAKAQTLDSTGVPTTANWTSAPEVVVGQYRVRYVVERLCTAPGAITDAVRQCVNKIKKPIESYTTSERPDPPMAKLFRVTVRVTGPRDTQTFVQSLLTRG
jgi:type IV pilus assembly protein PilX